MKGLEKEMAQNNFIKEAEDMGIPPAKWDKSHDSNDPLSKAWGWPLVDNTVGQSKEWGTVPRRLGSRSEIPGPSPVSSVLEKGPSVIWNGLVLLSKYVYLWTAQSSAKHGEGRRGKRLHARAWNES